MSIAVGIDLGTLTSSVSVYTNGEIYVIPNENGMKYIPSFVSFTETQRLIGEPAEALFVENPKNTVYGVKRYIGRRFDDPCLQEDMKSFKYKIRNSHGNPKICVTYKNEKREYDPEEISAMVLQKLQQNAEIMLGHQVTSAVITVPAFFNDSQRQATRDAGFIAGLNVLHILNEPAAAAIAYGIDKTLKDEKNVLVYDFGSGTFDACVMNMKQGSIFEVRSTVGDTHLGGGDLDCLILDYIADKFAEKYRKDIRDDDRASIRLKKACEQAKIELSSENQADISLKAIVEDIDLVYTITRSKFEKLCEPLFQRTISLVEQALKQSGCDKKEIDDIVVVGGCSKIPRVKSLLSNLFNGKYISLCVHPGVAVTYGAAVQAAILSGYEDKRIKDLMFVDITPLSIGIETTGGLMAILIEKGTSLPCKTTHVVTTYEDNQPGIEINVFEGERARVVDNNFLGKLELHGLPPSPRREPRIAVTFEIDKSGILTVSATEETRRLSERMSLDLVKGRLSPEDINRVIQEAQEFQTQDEEDKERIRWRNAFETYVYSINKAALCRKQTNLSNREKLEVQKICNEVYDWLQHNPEVDKDSLLEKRNSMIKRLQPFATALGLRAIKTEKVLTIPLRSSQDEGDEHE